MVFSNSVNEKMRVQRARHLVQAHWINENWSWDANANLSDYRVHSYLIQRSGRSKVSPYSLPQDPTKSPQKGGVLTDGHSLYVALIAASSPLSTGKNPDGFSCLKSSCRGDAKWIFAEVIP